MRHSAPFSVAVSLLAALAIPATRAFSDEAAKPAATTGGPVTYVVTYKTKVPAPAEGAKKLEAWIPVPQENALQKVADLKVTTTAKYEITKDDATGNRMVHVLVENPKGELDIDWVANVTRSEDSGQDTTAPVARQLEGDALAPVDGKAKELAKELGLDKSGMTAEEKAKKIYDHVLGTMEYSKDDKLAPGWGKGDFDRACKVGKGNCSDFVAKFVTIARASGIPARWNSSISLSGDHTGCSSCGYHCFAHYWNGKQWMPVDPSDARRIQEKDPAKAQWYYGHAMVNNIVLSMGRDLTLVPKQQAGPVNFFSGPYVEVDGKPISIPSTNRMYGAEIQK